MCSNKNKNMNKAIPLVIPFLLFLLLPAVLPAQEDEVSEPALEEAAVEVPAPVKLTPVFPDAEEGLIYIEGEDAVSTNFATSPVYNYGASGLKSLQLIQQNAPYGGQSYYAEYVFYVEEEGDYYFWYGGTPSGPAEDVYPSYASPFRYTLDNNEPVKIYRENQEVVQGYTPSYYWSQIGKVSLTQGVHTLRMEVSEKRRYDGQFYFFLDALFFLREDRMDQDLIRVPPLFPRERADRSINNPFQSVAYYEGVVKDNPGNKSAYIVLSMIYSLIGDYINAIKNLNKAVNLDPADPYPLLLMAKNRIWNGEVSVGLNLYHQLVTLAPENRAYWAEAGKMAAWTGRYRDSIDFFTNGLKQFPDDLNLKVNLGLTYLWMSRSSDALDVFQEAADAVREDHDRLMDLAEIHTLNGYPRNAVDLYLEEINRSPAYLETYLALEDAYRITGEKEKAEEVLRMVYDSFESSREFDSYMNVYEEKSNMKNRILEEYELVLDAQPDNISLRQELAQTYFWNGMQKEAVDESLRILVNKMYQVFKDFDNKANDLLVLEDKLAALESRYTLIEETYANAGRELLSVSGSYRKAEAALEKKPDNPDLAIKADELSLALSDAYGLAVLWQKRLDQAEEDFLALKEARDALFQSEEEEESLFRQLLGDNTWSWDRNFTKTELRQVQRDESFLVNYIQGRLALVEGRTEDAVRYLNQDLFSESPFARYGLYQAVLRLDDKAFRDSIWEEEAGMLALYKPYLSELAAAVWNGDAPEGGILIPSEVEVAELAAGMAGKAKKLGNGKKERETFALDVQEVLDRNLNRQIYYLEQETYLLRYELGDYYLDMGENLKASRQYDRVLAMDPWNLSANYKLGLVSQRYGNWYRAMKQYKKVYYQNPLYENAASYYNQLARAHADTVHISALNVTDPSRISYQADADYNRSLTNWLGWGFSYRMDVDSLYRTYGDEDSSSFKLQTLDLNLALTVPGWNLTVTPFGGFHLSNGFFGSDYDFNPEKAVSLTDNKTATVLKPRYGAGISWFRDFLTTNLDYRYELEDDSLFIGRNLTTSHTVEFNGNTYFPLDKNFRLGPVTTRTFGSFRLLNNQETGDNVLGQVIQEASMGFVVTEKPFIRLTVNGMFNYENSEKTGVTDYYAPEDVFEAKGGLRGAMSFHNAAYTESGEISLWGSAGGYWSAGGDPALKLEGQVSLSYTKDSLTFYLLTGANGTFDEGISGDPLYWELSATMGCRLNVPSLLVP